MKLSILTATYNRGDMLKNIYKSIITNKSNLKIEWIIIDDGSADDTKSKVKEFKEQKGLEIKYIYQENQGKMKALNNGIKYVTGDLIIDCDSDDFFEENSFNIIKENAHLFKDDIYALCFLKKNKNGDISGKKFEKDFQKIKMFDLYFKENMTGEKILVFNANIRKRFTHEVEEGEKFITEARMYHKMDENYNIICINKVIEVGDYLEEGYTKNISKIFKQNPKGYYKYFKEILKKDLKGVSLRKKLYILKNFVYFKLLKKQHIP